MKKNLFALLLIISLSIFHSLSYAQMPKGIYNLAGLWEFKNDEGTLYELWEINPDSTLQGKDFTINSNNDTIISEYFKVVPLDSGVYYIITVLNQNEGKPVYFKMTVWSLHGFVFENKNHDFPQMITYSVKTSDLYNVIIEGPEEGNKIKSIEFRFNRKKE